MRVTIAPFLLLVSVAGAARPRPADVVLDLWAGRPPGPTREVGPEQDFTRPTDRLIAGRRIIKLGNVRTPQIHVFRPEPAVTNGTAVVVCPGGGFSILAWDLEGTEVAAWLNGLGVTAVVLKYRVPTREQDPRWLAPVQDAQRALCLTRRRAADWRVDPNRVGILGFSAGANTAVRSACVPAALYPAVDEADRRGQRPDFVVAIYPGGLLNETGDGLAADLAVPTDCPPVFLAQAWDDPVPVDNSLFLALALRRRGIPCELHLYPEGGHGYGLRATEQPVTTWPQRCADWLRDRGWLAATGSLAPAARATAPVSGLGVGRSSDRRGG